MTIRKISTYSDKINYSYHFGLVQIFFKSKIDFSSIIDDEDKTVTFERGSFLVLRGVLTLIRFKIIFEPVPTNPLVPLFEPDRFAACNPNLGFNPDK